MKTEKIFVSNSIYNIKEKTLTFYYEGKKVYECMTNLDFLSYEDNQELFCRRIKLTNKKNEIFQDIHYYILSNKNIDPTYILYDYIENTYIEPDYVGPHTFNDLFD